MFGRTSMEKDKNATVILMDLGDISVGKERKLTHPVIRPGGPFLKVTFFSLGKVQYAQLSSF